MRNSENNISFFKTGKSNLLVNSIVLVIIILGVSFRLMRINNPPLDVHGWRWLRSAITARGMYYELNIDAEEDVRKTAIHISGSYPTLEPPITEGIVAATYFLIGEENLAVARIWTTIFWTIGGIATFLLSKKITSIDGAIVALAYYMLLPFANTETRAFMPEALMVMLIMLSLLFAYQWIETQSWRGAFVTGSFVGLAILTKVFAVFPLGLALLFLSLSTFGFIQSFKNKQIWLIAILAIIIPATYYYFPDSTMGGNYLSIWSYPFLKRLLDIWFYIGWIHKINSFFNLALVLISFASITLLEKKARALLFGLWAGYILFGMTFPSLIWSHSYYNLFLVGIISLSLSSAGNLFLKAAAEIGIKRKIIIWMVGILAIFYAVYMSRKAIVANDYSNETQKWEQLGEILSGHKTIGLTDDYNMRISYFGKKIVFQYPHYYDWVMASYSGNEFDVSGKNQLFFDTKIKDMEYFVVTLFDEFEMQPYLNDILYNQFQIVEQSDWYVIFDLHSKIN